MKKADCIFCRLFILFLLSFCQGYTRENTSSGDSLTRQPLLTRAATASDAEWQWSVPVKGGKTNPDARAWLWIPSSCTAVRTVIVAQNNMEELSILENAGFRQKMSELGIAEVWVSPAFDHSFRFTEDAGDLTQRKDAGEVFLRMMQDLANSSGYGELAYSPVIAIGHSAAASWPYYFGTWAPERTVACISVSGQWPYFRHPQFAPDIWTKDQNIDYIPSLETMGEFEAAATWSAEGLKERKEHPLMPLSMLACPAEGHFAATQKKIDYIAFYIRKAMSYRLPHGDPRKGPPHLKKIDPLQAGWLMDKWRADQPSTADPAPIKKYKGNPAEAFWFFDEEMIRATEKYESEWRGRKTPLLGYLQEGKIAQQQNTHLQVHLKWLPQPDGISFVLKGCFLDTVPGESPRPAMWTGLPAGSSVSHPDNTSDIRIDRVIGSFQKINDTLFQLAFEKATPADHDHTLTFAAVYPGDATYKPIVQQAEMKVPAANREGAEQHIDFPPIPDQKTGIGSLQLQASSDAGLEVHYYVKEGPATVAGDRLLFTQLPPRSQYPVKITVVAWQYGRAATPGTVTTPIQTAPRVQRSFFLREKDEPLPIDKVLRLAQQQYDAYITTHADSVRYPRSTNADGSLHETAAADWTSGFFPGCLWYLYRFTGHEQWKMAAGKWTRGLENEKDDKGTHDLGFMLYDSYGIGYAITKDPAYKKVLLQGARSLSTRFHPEVGAIRSWDNPDFHYPVIIDNLMNLEFLFWASKASGDPSFRNIAIEHANTDLKYRFRPDNSSYHVLDFDASTGKLLRRMTHQGYADSSCWARGQAWGIYGYTVLYRETKDQRYLQRAIKTADYFIAQTDKIADHIPYWDFQAPDIPNAVRDASAAAVAASALIELSQYAGRKYFTKAEEMLRSLCSESYLAQPGTNNCFLLKHSTGHKPHNSEIDVPIIYADYYLLEALWRYKDHTPAQPSAAPATYTNPILHADFSDPDAIRVGDDFYLTASSFNCMPGLPILHSKDLVNWSIIGHALPVQYPEDVYAGPQHGKGVWAPAIRWHKGEFYIYYPDPDYGIYVTKAKNAAGPWSKPLLVVGGKGLIDPCPLFEDDGKDGSKVWLVNGWAASRAEVNSLLTIRPLDPDGLHVAGEARMVFDGHDHQPTLEGPKLYKRNGYYYIFAPAGGVTHGWQLVLRSKNIYGPYEEKIVMDQGTTAINGPHQGAWVETISGESWFLHFQDKGAYGRILHLQPVTWTKDWPVIGADPDGDGKGEPVTAYRKPAVGATPSGPAPAAGTLPQTQLSDEFNGSAPGPQWQWQANPKITWMAEIPGSGYLRLFAFRYPPGAKNLWTVPNLLLQKFPAADFSATAKLRLTAADAGKKAALVIMGMDYAYIALEKQTNGFRIMQSVCKNAEGGGEENVTAGPTIADTPTGPASATATPATPFVYFRVTVSSPDALCHFSYSLDGNSYKDLGESFYASPGKWIGAKAGLFCLSPSDAKTGGYADIDWFRIETAGN